MNRAQSPTFSSLHLLHSSFSNPSVALPTSQLMSRAHSPTFSSLHLRHSSFSNPSVALPTSQLILQPFFRFSYVTGSSLTSPGEPPMFPPHKLILRAVPKLFMECSLNCALERSGCIYKNKLHPKSNLFESEVCISGT